MYICICNAVTEHEIRGAVALGCRTVADLKQDLGVGSCCGKCVPEAHKLLKSCAAKDREHEQGHGHSHHHKHLRIASGD